MGYDKKIIEQKIETAYQQLKEIQAKITNIGPIKKGTLSKRMMKCGKKNCRCHQDPEYRHGPYYWWTTKVKGRSKAVSVSKEMFETYQKFTKNYKRLKSIIKKMEDISDTILEEKTKLSEIKENGQ